MELNEFKDLFDKTTRQTPPTDQNITDMIAHDVKGPMAAFEKNLKFTIIIFPLVAASFTASFIMHSEARHSATKWLLLTILFTEFLFAVFNYGVVKKMKQPEGNVKNNMLGKIKLLQNSYRWYLLLHWLLYLLMAVVLEVVIHKHLEAYFEGWGRVNQVVRIAVYMAFLIFQFFVKRASQKKHYGMHLDKLQTLAAQMQ